jgi:hypothetical protein
VLGNSETTLDSNPFDDPEFSRFNAFSVEFLGD